MNKITVLVVEDDAPIRNLITTTLTLHSYKVLNATNGREALLFAAANNPAAIFLDLGLPDMDGVDMIRSLREWSNIPILVISARSDDRDKVGALDAGADDYLTKPFSVEELLARLRAAIRRLESFNTGQTSQSVFINGGLKIDFAAGCTYLNDQELHLTPIEYKMLCLLAQNIGKVLTHTFMTQKIWGSSFDGDVASLRVHMATLRKKINSGNDSTQYIQTHVGIGYRMIKTE